MLTQSRVVNCGPKMRWVADLLGHGWRSSLRLVSLLCVAGGVAWLLLGAPVHHMALKPVQPSAKLGSISDIRADDDEPRQEPTRAQVATLHAVLGGKCRANVRAELEQRRLPLRAERIAALCRCDTQLIVDTRGGGGGDEWEGLALVSRGFWQERRRALSNGAYLDAFEGAERACAER